jgi:hypothetical protein
MKISEDNIYEKVKESDSSKITVHNPNKLHPTIINDTTEKKRMHFSYLEMFRLFWFPCCVRDHKLKKKMKLYKLAEIKMQKKLEIKNVMKKFEEIERLKSILFKSNQIQVFEKSSKEICSLDANSPKYREDEKISPFIEEQDKIIEKIGELEMKLNNLLSSFSSNRNSLNMSSEPLAILGENKIYNNI